MVGTADSVLIREVSLIQSVLYREVPMYWTPRCWLFQCARKLAYMLAFGQLMTPA